MPVAYVPLTAAPTHLGAFRRPVTTVPASTYTPPGTPILIDQLGSTNRLVIEFAFGADLRQDPTTWQWTDVTTDALTPNGGKIRMTIAALGESFQTSPAELGLVLDNRTGDYSAYSPYSSRWPYVRRNTPVRVRFSFDGSLPYATWYTLYEGLAKGFVPDWDVTGQYAVAKVAAAGTLYRLGKPGTPAHSALYRAVIATNPVSYYPLEDASAATVAASALSGGLPLGVTPTNQTAAPTFASITGPGGSDRLPDFTNAASLAASTTGPASTSTPWSIAIAVKFPSAVFPAVSQALTFWSNTGTVVYWRVEASHGPGLVLSGLYSSGAVSFSINTNVNVDGDNTWHWVKIDAAQAGPNVNVNIYIDGVLQSGPGPVVLSSQTLGPITSVQVNQQQSDALYPQAGHLVLWNSVDVADLTDAMNGYAGETATARLSRLCSAAGIPITILGTSDTTMGAQSIAKIADLLRECETADGGVLFDGLNGGLSYTTRAYRYNRAATLTLDASAGEPADPIAPADDDLRDRNRITVSRTTGSSGLVEVADGPRGTRTILDYDQGLTVNHEDDTVLTARAGFEARKGTFDGFRYPTQEVDFAANPSKLASWLQTSVSHRIDMTNVRTVRPQHPPETVDLILEGYTQEISKFAWRAFLNCSPNDPFRVMVIQPGTDRAAYTWRVDAAATYLRDDATAGTTSLVVQTLDGYLWSTDAGDYPRDIDVGGAKVTVTAVAAATGVLQTLTVTALPYRLLAGWRVKLWRPPAMAL